MPCAFVNKSLVVGANLETNYWGNDEEMRDFESGLSTFQIVCYVPLCVVGVLLFCISWESTLHDGNSKEILRFIRPWDCGCQDVEGLWFSLSNSWGSSVSMECHCSLCNVSLTCWQPMHRWVLYSVTPLESMFQGKFGTCVLLVYWCCHGVWELLSESLWLVAIEKSPRWSVELKRVRLERSDDL
jgi:hypothetical protein